jgi:signal transduction histidine kinase
MADPLGDVTANDHLAYARGMERLLHVVQELSMARDLPTIQAIVRRAARELTGADGATFVLRDHDKCYYADEDAIEPLWKGMRFPIENCVSGWAMTHREEVVIEDIYADPRVPGDAYRPTFVKSLAMVPIRRLKPVGAIGNYWAVQHKPSETEVRLLQALADSTSIAMENVELLLSLEQRVAERTRQLEAANHELEAFSYAVSHDLRAPLRAIGGFSQILREDHADALDASGRGHLDRICAATGRMGELIGDLLELSKVSRGELARQPFDLAAMAREVVEDLRQAEPARQVEVAIPAALPAHGDARLIRVVLVNLLANAWKFSAKRADARIEVGQRDDGAFFVRDNGAGFEPSRAHRLFVPFQRMHAASEFEGTGVGLATAQRVVVRHGGKIWADAAVGAGATFWFTLPAA